MKVKSILHKFKQSKDIIYKDPNEDCLSYMNTICSHFLEYPFVGDVDNRIVKIIKPFGEAVTIEYNKKSVKLFHELNSIDFKEPIKVKSNKLLKFLIKIKLLERF